MKKKSPVQRNAYDDPSSIGNVLMKLGRLTREQLHQAVGRQAQFNDALLGALLRELGFVSDRDVTLALKIQCEMREGREVHAELDVLQEKMNEVEASGHELKTAISDAKSRRRERGENSQIVFLPRLATVGGGR